MLNSPRNECILAIGETGLGKSFTATIFGATGVKVGHSTESETDKVTFCDIGNGSFYIDTPGFNDSNEEKSDDETVCSILREMQDRKISNITTILWFVKYDCKASAYLKSQARTIEAFARDHNGNVWDNTIIVTKDDKRGEGPRAAAEEIAKKIYEQKPRRRELNAKKSFLENTGNFEIFLFESLDGRKKDIYATFPIEALDKLNIFKSSKPDRILAKYRSLMEGHIRHPIVLEFKMPSLPPNQRILAIGGTGLGKSFTATIFGAKGVKVGHSTKSETDEVTFYDIGNGSFYVDTPGFNDSNEEKTDDETVRSILREMQDRKISNITTILWFVTNECRETASLKQQAKFIEALARDHDGNVWDNAIIVTKGNDRGKGPRAAAEAVAKEIYEQKHRCRKPDAKSFLNNVGNFEICLFERLDESLQSDYINVKSDELNRFRIFKESEPHRIFTKYRSLMEGHSDHPIVLEFKKIKCLNCSEETDPRLASPKCHLKEKLIHPKLLEAFHRDRVGNFHPDQPVDSKIVEEWDHGVGAWTLRVVTIGLVNLKEYKLENGKWKCCNRKLGEDGCKPQYKCCRKSASSTGCMQKYSCCDVIPHDFDNCEGCKSGNCKGPGCISVCSGCEQISIEHKGCSIVGKHVWPSSPKNKCILAIGETGLGKSFTATIFGAKGVKVGHSTESTTFYDIGNSSFYVDTPGFNDIDEEKFDDETIRSILREMQDRKISKITTILWFVRTDGCRATTSLKSQARTIEAFARDHNGNVWDNTIIVTKGDERGEGPRAAAEEIAKKIHEQKPHHRELNAKKSFLENTGYFEIRLFESLSEIRKKNYDGFTNNKLSDRHIFKSSEPDRILAKYRSLMEGHIRHPIVLEFKKVKCLNCSEETDPSEGIGQFHPAEQELVIRRDHVRTIWIANPLLTYEWKCCGRQPDSEGCTSLYTCCRQPIGSAVCSKCEKNPLENEGCSIEGEHVWGQ
ncbi:7996_t:CDS:2 [Paraglomus brasilianum]|uniref:7996_t:CDS:1 n=1 Tax=Paraglomus brasilianum TaxID=144538 RepID=A0A9N9C8R1_9GLOM|nr:7996_t:CDS:2 [Paraglomus brasilianum]